MAFKPRLRLPRRQSVLSVEYDQQQFTVWCPNPDTTVTIADFGDASSLAATIGDLAVQREALVLLDAHRRITGDPGRPTG